jgi:hypothetical protein
VSLLIECAPAGANVVALHLIFSIQSLFFLVVQLLWLGYDPHVIAKGVQMLALMQLQIEPNFVIYH